MFYSTWPWSRYYKLFGENLLTVSYHKKFHFCKTNCIKLSNDPTYTKRICKSTPIGSRGQCHQTLSKSEWQKVTSKLQLSKSDKLFSASTSPNFVQIFLSNGF